MSAQPVKDFLPIKWSNTVVDTSTRFVTNFVIQKSAEEYILSFYEIRPPLIFGDPNDPDVESSEVTEVNAECVARIVVTPSKYKELVELLTRSLDNVK